MRFLNLSAGRPSSGRIVGINLDWIVYYEDDPQKDVVNLYTGLYGAGAQTQQFRLVGEERRAFFDAIGGTSDAP